MQACGLRDNMDELKKAGVEVLGISTDKPEKLSRFAEKELLNFTLLSDEITRSASSFVFGAKKPSWVKPMTVFISASWWTLTAKLNTYLMTSKPADHHDIVLGWLQEHA
ncbi:redoxin domain-containing protein [Shigella flexneri]